MTSSSWTQIALYLALLLLLAGPCAWLIVRGLSGRRLPTSFLEGLIWRLLRIDPAREMSWVVYAGAILAFNVLGFVVLFALQRFQHLLPLNADGLGAVSPASSFNTAVSFVTNTNWQGYAGEVTMSHVTQMAGLGVQNFVSAATGLAVLAALARALRRKTSATIGNAWADLVRSTVHVLLPLSVVLALFLVSQGVVQSFEPSAHAAPVRAEMADQALPLGPAASQIAIKQLGTNGGGFFNTNSAHPFENPTPASNLLELLAILVLPAACCLAFGRWVADMRQGWALLAAMLIVFVPLVVGTATLEQQAPPGLAAPGVDVAASADAPGGNMEGKEVRFGIGSSALWAVATTAASNGSVNAMHDSFTPLGGLVPMMLMQLGEVIFGGLGSGLYGMLLFVVLAVFVAGLMVGRSPEYLGKKVEPFEMKMASLGILVPCAAVLVGTALAVSLPAGHATLANPGAHGFSELLYAYSSASNNNGSAFAGLGADTPFHNLGLGLCMLVGRFAPLIAALALAGSLAAKRVAPAGEGTLPTHSPLFIGLLVATIVLVGALSFVPALALGPVVEHLQMRAGGGS
jgi:potassium-transporting ATPase potassium-binding subunit